MSYTKTIVCLANSRKLAGRCVAGKEWDGRNLGARRIGAAIEKQALHAQGVPGKGEHASQLPGTHYSNAQ